MNLSAHFSLLEFACHDGKETPPEAVANLHKLCMQVLEPLRMRWGAPIVVISGYRSPSWNLTIGGAKFSTHMTGEGADVRPLNPADLPAFASTVEELRLEGDLQGLGGFGKYTGWIHLDTKRSADGHLRRWTGRGVGAEITEAS